MKVVHISTYCDGGGAAQAAVRLNQAFNQNGIESHLLVLVPGKHPLAHVTVIPHQHSYEEFLYHINNKIGALLRKVGKPWGDFDLLLSGFSIKDHPLVQEADVIYVQTVYKTLNYQGIRELLDMGKPVIWYMHDMFPITGGCHHSFECTEYERDCMNCKFTRYLGGHGLSSWQLRKKKHAWEKYQNFYGMSPSNWLTGCARRSSLFHDKSCFVIPNSLDTNIFRPMDKKSVKKELGLDENKKTILFSADVVNSPYKGFSYLKKALAKLSKDKYQALVFGQGGRQDLEGISMEATFLGRLTDQEALVKAYNAADVFVIPSMAEAFGYVIIESMACGVPCVGFNVGGIPDLIHTEETGYLANYKDVDDLTRGIEWIFADEERYQRIASRARSFVEEYCSYDSVAAKHKQILAKIFDETIR
ncbi:MAG: glycosyltransferase [Prevotella sp.]|nr:glycosyltransferase [Prevotella sp.]